MSYCKVLTNLWFIRHGTNAFSMILRNIWSLVTSCFYYALNLLAILLFFFHFNGAHSNPCTQTTISFIFGKLCAATLKNLLDRKKNIAGDHACCEPPTNIVSKI